MGSAVYGLGPLACPRCGRREQRYADVFGVMRLRCDDKRACQTSWTAVRIPPGATGQLLADAFGVPVARAIVLSLRPEDDPMDDATLLLVPLPATPDPLYLQRAPDTPEPAMGWRRASAILSAIVGA